MKYPIEKSEQEWKEQLSLVNQNIEDYPFPVFLKEILGKKITYASDNSKVFKILYMEFIYQENMRDNLVTLIPIEIVKEINEMLDYYKLERQVVDLPNKELFGFLVGTVMTFVIQSELVPSIEKDKINEIENMIVFLTKGLTP